MLWLPAERVLFAGDILLEDGVTMVVDGNSGVLLRTLDLIDSLEAAGAWSPATGGSRPTRAP